jgi:hypothetical protein
MFHPSTTWIRYARIERVMDTESTGVLCAGAAVMLAGMVREESLLLMLGIAIFITGFTTWTIRRYALLRRRGETPRMVFVSDDGISAILPNRSSMRLRWNGLSAHEFCHIRGGLPGKSNASDTAMRGMMLKNAIGQRLYLTHDLDGYEEFLEILVDLDVPVHATSHTFVSSRGSFTDWKRNLERRTWEESN